MRTRFNKRAVCGVAAAASMLLAGAAQAALQDRDLNGDAVVDAFYDTDLDITWLRDANVNGAMDWDSAVSWADSYSLGGYSDWRLPSSDTCRGYFCDGSEMGHLWYSELGNRGGSLNNPGDFQNLTASSVSWSGLEHSSDSSSAWFFSMNIGHQDIGGKFNRGSAMAVRPGDVTAVPEPESLALMLAGLAVLAGAAHRRPG